MSGGLDGLALELERAAPRSTSTAIPFAELSTYRVGGPVAVLVRVGSDRALAKVVEVTRRHRPRLLVVGRGSNLLMTDAGFSGVVVKLEGSFEAVDLPATADEPVRAGGGVALPVLARRTAAAGWTGLEFYVGIPGSMGGAVRMNAGGHGQETVEVLRRAWVVDLLGEGAPVSVEERSVAELGLAYRRSGLGASEVVTGAELSVAPDEVAACEARIDEVVRWRREHQPGGANAGSVFRNPPGDTAGRLIEAAGCKGLRIGGAVVSEKHANFVQGEPGATSADVRRLVAEVQRRVEESAGVRLEPELHVVGDADEADAG